MENNSFEIIDKKINETSFWEINNKLYNQFNILPEFGLDKFDYFRNLVVDIFRVDLERFPNNFLGDLDDEEKEMLSEFLKTLAIQMYNIFGIIFDENSDNYVENMYNMYYFIIVKPETLIKDYLLYYNMYVDEYDFINFYKQSKFVNNVLIPDVRQVNPVKFMNSVYEMYYGNTERRKDITSLTYSEMLNYFVMYASQIFGDMNEFNGSEIFKKMNIMSPCDNYDKLDDEFNVHFGIRFESDELFVKEFFIRNFDVVNEENYIVNELMNPFFKYIDDLNRILNLSLSKD